MRAHEKLLLANKAWVQEKQTLRPEFFSRLAIGQQPDFLWIGCSDSRVPAEEVTGAQPGEVFVHRNIANLFVHSDINLNSVLQFAVEFLKVKHVIVCGHYGCGGVKAALTPQNFGLINNWIYPIKETYLKHRTELEGMTEEQVFDRVVEWNVKEQVRNLSNTAIIQNAWSREGGPSLHGWVFGLKDGLLRELVEMGPGNSLESIHKLARPA